MSGELRISPSLVCSEKGQAPRQLKRGLDKIDIPSQGFYRNSGSESSLWDTTLTNSSRPSTYYRELTLHHGTGMVRKLMGRSTRSIYLCLAFLSLALHLLLAFFCLTVLQTACVLPPSSSSIRRAEGQNAKVNITALHDKTTYLNINKLVEKVSSHSKLGELFSHPLYNLPRPELQEDDWLLRLKSKEENEDAKDDSNWESDSEEKGYEKISWTQDEDTHPPWLRFHLGITRWQLYDRRDPTLEQLTQYLATERILGAVQKSGGTQLKLVISFPNYGQALLKPMKQSRDAETDFNLFYFSDFERHNAEIAAYHLDRVLGFNRIPPVVGRLINVITEIKDITTDRKLSRTFFTSPVGNVCFYGQCEYYCSTEHPVCGRPHALEVSLAAMLPDLKLAPRRSWRSPWRRSYSRTKLASWEKDPHYCDTVKQTPPYDKGTRLVDVIDMAILDFLMSNMDRHHYETFEKFGNETFLLHLDNGRAFGRHSIDEPSILVPLKQCCRIRRSTLLRLRLLSQPSFRLSDVLRESLSQDPVSAVAPLLSEAHLSALDRRLDTVLKTIRHCQDKHQDVVYNDMEDSDHLSVEELE